MKKILIIEDDDILQRMYQQKLRAQGFDVIEARDGKTGLYRTQTEKPDLILLDIMLPGGLNGFDILEQLKRDPRTEHIAVLVLTNLETEEKVANELGASGYLVKANTKPDLVLVAINELLKPNTEIGAQAA